MPNRLTNEILKLDLDGLRRGRYTDRYFINISQLLTELAAQGQRLSADYLVGDAEVEIQTFTRRAGTTLIAGVDVALAMLRHCTGYWQDNVFISTANDLQIWAVSDGDTVDYHGQPTEVQPVLRVRGRYRDIAHLETTTLGVLTRASRVATNMYQAIQAANGKAVLFFPARFDLPETQTLDGYAYYTAIQRYNQDSGHNLQPFISTDAQGAWWGGRGGGTIPHAAIACFLGDTAATTLAFAHQMPPEILRIALVDFKNDSVETSLSTALTLFKQYMLNLEKGDPVAAEKYRLFAVRLDTSSNMIDQALTPTGEAQADFGVNPRLVHAVRHGLDNGWQNWEIPDHWRISAQRYCEDIKIIASGGFDAEKIARFETAQTPVNIYAIGSAALDNHGPTKTDFTADIVRVKYQGEWIEMAKTGRAPADNPDLKKYSSN